MDAISPDSFDGRFIKLIDAELSFATILPFVSEIVIVSFFVVPMMLNVPCELSEAKLVASKRRGSSDCTRFSVFTNAP